LSTAFRLVLPRQIYEALLEQARAELPNECCGLLAGRREGAVGRVARRYPLVNASASPVEYLSEGPSHLAAHRDLCKAGLEELAVYHSHPTTEPIPSRTDLERNLWPGVVHLIVSMRTSSPEMRGWWLREDSYTEAEWEIVEENAEQSRQR
jgi:proteasome lid subunit RPN8/RPN11